MEGTVSAIGTTLSWSAAFRAAMEELCAVHGVPGPVPVRVGLMPVKAEGVILVWPVGAEDPAGITVTASANARRVTNDLAEAFAKLGAHIPPGIATEMPFARYQAKHGQCLALSLSKANFLYKRSRGSAIGLLDGE